jgi:hypothetical protein
MLQEFEVCSVMVKSCRSVTNILQGKENSKEVVGNPDDDTGFKLTNSRRQEIMKANIL